MKIYNLIMQRNFDFYKTDNKLKSFQYLENKRSINDQLKRYDYSFQHTNIFHYEAF